MSDIEKEQSGTVENPRIVEIDAEAFSVDEDGNQEVCLFYIPEDIPLLDISNGKVVLVPKKAVAG